MVAPWAASATPPTSWALLLATMAPQLAVPEPAQGGALHCSCCFPSCLKSQGGRGHQRGGSVSQSHVGVVVSQHLPAQRIAPLSLVHKHLHFYGPGLMYRSINVACDAPFKPYLNGFMEALQDDTACVQVRPQVAGDLHTVPPPIGMPLPLLQGRSGGHIRGTYQATGVDREGRDMRRLSSKDPKKCVHVRNV